ncbi:MAG: hypothetical protein R3C52_09140 [Hyphomonadaceae bacterium]
MNEPTDQQLFGLIFEEEDKALAERMAPKGRHFEIPSRVMERLGYRSFILGGAGKPPVLTRIERLHARLYRTEDVGIGGLHGGVFMFRGIFGRFYIPISYGAVMIDPFKLTDFSDDQLRWIGTRQEDVENYIDQFAHVFDFAGGAYGLGGYAPPPKPALDMFRLAGFQFQAAAATLSAAFDARGAIQSSLIGTELALKAGLLASGSTEAQIKSHSHNLKSAATELATRYASFDLASVLATVDAFPAYVANRYSSEQPDHFESGEIAMGAQFVAGEVMRSVTGGDFRSKLVKG